MSRSRKNILTIVFVLLFYAYIYAPPFRAIPFGCDKLFIIWAAIYLFNKHLFHNLLVIFQKEFFLLSLICIFSTITTIINGTSLTSFCKYDFLFLLEAIPCAFFLYYLFNSKSIDNKFKIILYASFIAGVSTLFLILNPQLAFNLKQNILKYPESLLHTMLYRGYGFAEGLVSVYPIVQGYCIGLVLIRFNKTPQLFNFILIILLLLSIMTNARSGFVPVLIAIVLALIFKFKQSISIAAIGTILLLLLGSSILTFISNNDMLGQAFEWGNTTWSILGDILSGNIDQAENMNALTDSMIVFPKGTDWIFGTGRSIILDEINNSDIGYIIRLNYGGVFYLSIELCLYIYMFRRSYMLNKLYALFIFLPIIYINWKGDFFIIHSLARFVFLLYVWMICYYEHINKRKLYLK